MTTTQALAILFVASAVALRPPGARAVSAPSCANVSLREAHIISYLIPRALELRAKMGDVTLEYLALADRDTPGKFNFQIRNAVNGDLIGNFSVDKCTGVLADADMGNVVTSPTLQGVQRILRDTTTR